MTDNYRHTLTRGVLGSLVAVIFTMLSPFYGALQLAYSSSFIVNDILKITCESAYFVPLNVE